MVRGNPSSVIRCAPSVGPGLKAARCSRGFGLLSLCLLVALAGCSPTRRGKTPHDALVAYTEAIEAGRYDEAYDLLSTETRARLSRSAFAKLLREHPEEVASLARAVRGSGDSAEVRATITGKDGQRLELVYENQAWRVESSALDLYPQKTPEKALASFVTAYDKNRYDVLLKFVPEAHLEGLDEEVLRQAWEGEQKVEMDAIVEGMRAALTDPQLEVIGSRATLAIEGGATVELLLEAGVWKIEDFK